MIRLYIADTDPAFILKARHVFAHSRVVEIIGACDNGRRALRDIIGLKPDVLLTDIQLPEMDGISLLRETRRMSCPPSVIICTRFYSDVSIEQAIKYGAAYFMCKPIDFERLSELIVWFAQNACRSMDPGIKEDDTRMQSAAFLLLSELGLPMNLNGTAYLMESVKRLQANRLLLRNLSKGLYNELASRYNTTVPCVERSLRSAIIIGYERGTIKDIFPQRPTNREFIEYLMNALAATPQSRQESGVHQALSQG